MDETYLILTPDYLKRGAMYETVVEDTHLYNLEIILYS